MAQLHIKWANLLGFTLRKSTAELLKCMRNRMQFAKACGLNKSARSNIIILIDESVTITSYLLFRLLNFPRISPVNVSFDSQHCAPLLINFNGQFYSLDRSVRFAESDNEAWLIQLREGSTYSIGKTGWLFIHYLLNNQGSLSQVANQIANLYGEREEVVLNDLLNFVQMLIDGNLLKHTPAKHCTLTANA